MKRRRRTLVALLAAAILALALSACGDGGEEAPSTTNSSREQGYGREDSGGGSGQFRTEGGDNSVQEFGEEAGGSDFEEAAAALHGFLDARAGGEWAAACSYLAPSVIASLEQTAAQMGDGEDESCAAGLEAMRNPIAEAELRAEAAQADVGSVRVEGESGFAVYRVGETPYAVAIALKGGEWKVAGLGGYPLR